MLFVQAICQGDKAVLKDWCLEAEFNKLTAAHKLATDRRCKIEQEIIDVDQVDVSSNV